MSEEKKEGSKMEILEPLKGPLKGGSSITSLVSNKELNKSLEEINKDIGNLNKFTYTGKSNLHLTKSLLTEIEKYMNNVDFKIIMNADKTQGELAFNPSVIGDTKLMVEHIKTLAEYGKMLSGNPNFGQETIDNVKSALEGAKSSQLQQLSQPLKSNAELNKPLDSETKKREAIKNNFITKTNDLVTQQGSQNDDPTKYQESIRNMVKLRGEINTASSKPENKEIKSELTSLANILNSRIINQPDLPKSVSKKAEPEKIATKIEEPKNTEAKESIEKPRFEGNRPRK